VNRAEKIKLLKAIKDNEAKQVPFEVVFLMEKTINGKKVQSDFKGNHYEPDHKFPGGIEPFVFRVIE
jgi:hypothetical protein